MGRVYNALVKADRLTGDQRPIGRPAADNLERPRRRDAETPRHDQAVPQQHADTAIGGAAPAVRKDSTPPAAFSPGYDHQGTTVENSDDTALFDSDSNVAPADFD